MSRSSARWLLTAPRSGACDGDVSGADDRRPAPVPSIRTQDTADQETRTGGRVFERRIGLDVGRCRQDVLDRRSWSSRGEQRIVVVRWIEWTHHRRHGQDALGRLTPLEYETIMTTPATQAA